MENKKKPVCDKCKKEIEENKEKKGNIYGDPIVELY